LRALRARKTGFSHHLSNRFLERTGFARALYLTYLPLPAPFNRLGKTRRNSMISLRPATEADVALLRHWDEQPHVIAADPNDDWGWEDELRWDPDWREQFIAELDGRPIGFIQIIDPAREESHYWGEIEPNLRAIDIWIGEAADLSKGYGTTMMQMAIAHCFSDPSVNAILIDPLASNTRARRFYERLGFYWVEYRRFGHDDCAVYRLDRVKH
jgi:aminoglycoside 6'-N-acetyltransferase